MTKLSILKNYINYAQNLPPPVLLKNVLRRAKRLFKEQHIRLRDKYKSSYIDKVDAKDLYRSFPRLDVKHLKPIIKTLRGITDYYLGHRFDLLGSGWVKVHHGMNCQGLERYRYCMGKELQADHQGKWLAGRINSANLATSQKIWRRVDTGYAPIDWHLDFKSGYRWSEKTWYKDIVYGDTPGVDVKVPWELARMQHLTHLAWAFALGNEKQSSFKPPQTYVREFCNQVLDFISTNPPRFGVNWACTMEVGIRVSNWLTAYDLLRAFGAKFDSEFEKIFRRSVYEHGLHIINNLEWNEELTSNHYLSNIVGLLFSAAFLAPTSEINDWLVFAILELITEVPKQFYKDGANFEASTSYHRLSSEMVLYASTLLLGMPETRLRVLQSVNCDRLIDKQMPARKAISLNSFNGADPLTLFPDWYFKSLEKMAEFTMHITKPNQQIPQVGDNDSGRFLKIHPVYRRITVAEAKSHYANLIRYNDLPDQADYWDEDHLDHRSLVAGMNGLFQRHDFTEFSGPGWIDTYLIKALAGELSLPSYWSAGKQTDAGQVRIGKTINLIKINAKKDSLHENSRKLIRIPVPETNIYENLQLFAYPDFGIYIFRSERLYLALRCGPIGQNGNGGHAHNDQLSLELTIDGRNWICDPGTYVYTPLPEKRNEYRSVTAHYAPQVKGLEPGNLQNGLFCLGNDAQGSCLYFGEDGFVGMHHGYGFPVFRTVMLLKNTIQIIDHTTVVSPLEDMNQPSPDQSSIIPFSSGYGLRHA
jgi:hypothetical protein